MWNPISEQAVMADFWAPRPNGVWRKVLTPLRKFYLKKFYAVKEVTVEGAKHLSAVREGDGVMLTPNHSHDSDPHVMMEVAKRLERQFYFMAAWQIFKGHRGIDGFVLQRMGAFSVDREGCDRRAMRQAVELMTTGRWLVVFPEGEIYHTNERLTPLREGVAFMAGTAQKDLEKEGKGRKVWIVPTAIRYKYLEDVTPQLEAAMDDLEERMKLKSGKGSPLAKRIMRFGDAMLTIKEKEQLGKAGDGELAGRLKALVTAILDRNETKWMRKTQSDCSVSLRVKTLRQQLLEIWFDEEVDVGQRAEAKEGLDDVQLVMQLYSYPGDYVLENPSVERMAETIEKFEEDVYGGIVRPKGERAARVVLGRPLDVSTEASGLRPRAAATELTGKLERTIKELMGAGKAEASSEK
ncbi:MAG: phospholipid/glycerol acyltransferase [Phycisphaerales bacterium]|nr:phospholipid/glycerol acyltransferase [Phycisphaerales bacterium]